MPKKKITPNSDDFVDVTQSGISSIKSMEEDVVDESLIYRSMDEAKNILMSENNNSNFNAVINALRVELADNQTYLENEDLSKDAIVGQAMEMITDDVSQTNPATGCIVAVDSPDAEIAKFINTFLYDNFDIENRFWEIAYDVAKHGDFKLRRKIYNDIGSDVKNAYYENVLHSHKVSRIEYMGKCLCYIDEDSIPDKPITLNPDDFVHFYSTKLPKRKKVVLQVKRSNSSTQSDDGYTKGFRNDGILSSVMGVLGKKNPMKEDVNVSDISCFKVSGVSLFDNARYIYRATKLIDELSMVGIIKKASTYNLVKVEVGNSDDTKATRTVNNVKRIFESNTKIKKGAGIDSTSTVLPNGKNIYIPTKSGVGDVNIEAHSEGVDVFAGMQPVIDHFTSKLCATTKTPKAYLGFDEALPGQISAYSLSKIDIRYSRNVSRLQKILINGFTELVKNYMRFRGKPSWVNNFTLVFRKISTADAQDYFEELLARLELFNKAKEISEGNEEYIDRAKLLAYVFEQVGADVNRFATKEYKDFIENVKKDPNTEFKPNPENTKKANISNLSAYGKDSAILGTDYGKRAKPGDLQQSEEENLDTDTPAEEPDFENMTAEEIEAYYSSLKE